jgi:hypothetical protein
MNLSSKFTPTHYDNQAKRIVKQKISRVLEICRGMRQVICNFFKLTHQFE